MQELKQLTRAIETYDKMVEQSYLETGHQLFRGSLQLLIHPSYYAGQTRELLVNMGCIAVRHRGGGRNNPNVWELLQPPTEALYREAAESKYQREPKKTDYFLLIAQVNRIDQEVASLRSAVLFLTKKLDELMELEAPEPLIPSEWEEVIATDDAGDSESVPEV